jgi:hypothetical protein
MALFTVFLSAGQGFCEPATTQEVEKLQAEALDQVDNELERAKDDLNTRKNQEIQIVESSRATSKTKEKLISRIEKKYLDLEKQIIDKTNTRKKQIIDYYTNMKKELAVDEQKAVKRIKETFVPPQKLLGKWFIVGYQFLGTLKFSSHKGMLVANIYVFKYNKWEDLYNLTYDGMNIAFDYENPYGIKLHFEGLVDPKGNLIKGQLIDLKDDLTYEWKAYR